MTAEQIWYTMHDHRGNAPHLRRLSRLPRGDQWMAAIDLAIAHAEGRALYRETHISLTGESYWYWPGGPDPQCAWWLVAPRIERRVHKIIEAATRSVLRRNRGSARESEIVAALRRWRQAHTWRKVAARIYPRHAPHTTQARPGRESRDARAKRQRLAMLRKKHRRLCHYTLNTDHTRMSPRSEVGDDVIETLRPLLGIEDDQPLPPPLAVYALAIQHVGEGLFATIEAPDGRPCIAFGAAMSERGAADVWPKLESLYLRVTDRPGFRRADFAAPRKPNMLPCCAAMTVLATPEEAMWMADFERCLAWAWIEQEEGK